MRTLLCLFLLTVLATSRQIKHHQKKHGLSKTSNLDFVGCPLNNDFFYNGTIYSPLWPASYPPNDQCYYYVTAEPGKVMRFDFTYFDLETCCDYVTIYDGEGMNHPILARFGGPNMTAPIPTGPIYSSTRQALVTFTSDYHIEQSGFQMTFSSAFNANPCPRDILLTINGMSAVGSQDNFVKQLNFFADNLTTTWEVALNKVRVMINLQIDDDFAVVYKTTDNPTNSILSNTIRGLTNDVPNVMDNNNTSVNGLFRYTEDALSSLGTKEFAERAGIERVAIIIVPQNPNNDQDYFESYDMAHAARNSDDSKLIVISIGSNVDGNRLGQLAQSSAAAFHVNTFDELPSLVSSINAAICGKPAASCGP